MPQWKAIYPTVHTFTRTSDSNGNGDRCNGILFTVRNNDRSTSITSTHTVDAVHVRFVLPVFSRLIFCLPNSLQLHATEWKSENNIVTFCSLFGCFFFVVIHLTRYKCSLLFGQFNYLQQHCLHSVILVSIFSLLFSSLFGLPSYSFQFKGCWAIVILCSFVVE